MYDSRDFRKSGSLNSYVFIQGRAGGFFLMYPVLTKSFWLWYGWISAYVKLGFEVVGIGQSWKLF